MDLPAPGVVYESGLSRGSGKMEVFFWGAMFFTHVQALFQSFFWLGYAWQPRVGNFYGYAWLGVLVRALDMSNLD